MKKMKKKETELNKIAINQEKKKKEDVILE
jgi:hypothetical protein